MSDTEKYHEHKPDSMENQVNVISDEELKKWFIELANVLPFEKVKVLVNALGSDVEDIKRIAEEKVGQLVHELKDLIAKGGK